MDYLDINSAKMEFEKTVLQALENFKQDTGFEIDDIKIDQSWQVTLNAKGCRSKPERKRALNLKIRI